VQHNRVAQSFSSPTPVTAGHRERPYILVVNANLLDYQKGDDPTFVAHQGLEGLQRLAPEWSALAHSLPGARFMHFPEWYRAYLSSLASDPARVWFIAAYRDEELAAVFPLEFQDHRVGVLRPHVFGTIDDEQMQLSDFVFAQTAENEDLLYQLTQWLRTQRTLRWHELRLRKVREDSSIAHAVRARLPAGTVALRHDGSSYFLTNGTYDQATQAMSGSFKRNLRRLARRAEQSAPLRFQSYRRPEALAEAFEILINIEASGWKGNSGTASAICCRPAMLEFYRALVREFGARDACVINVLWHGEHAVAGQFCLHIGDTLNVLKIGFSDAHSHIAPGNLLLERTIQHACDDRGIDIVSLVNQPPWSKSFKPLTIGVWSYCAPNWSVQGCLVHLGLLGKRAWDTMNRARPTEGGAEPRVRSIGADGNDAETQYAS
jgi:CelD/BcsL family acetyltransferase involved in cellulose biosynthesis